MKNYVYVLIAAMLLVVASAALKVLDAFNYASIGISIGALAFVIAVILILLSAMQNKIN